MTIYKVQVEFTKEELEQTLRCFSMGPTTDFQQRIAMRLKNALTCFPPEKKREPDYEMLHKYNTLLQEKQQLQALCTASDMEKFMKLDREIEAIKLTIRNLS